MTIAASGSISLSTVLAEHGGSTPISMSSYLRGSASGLVHSSNSTIPATAPVSLSSFIGTSRSGKYPFVVGRWANGSEYQIGYHHTNGGSISFNRYYKGYTIQSFAWNQTTDGLVGVGFMETNVPQSVLTYMTTSVLGTRTVTAYYPDFLGSHVVHFRHQ